MKLKIPDKEEMALKIEILPHKKYVNWNKLIPVQHPRNEVTGWIAI